MSTEITSWPTEPGWYAGPWTDEVYYFDDRGRWHTSMTKLEDTSHIAKTRLVPADTSVVDNTLLDLVLDTYTDEGVGIWCRNWYNASASKRAIMRAALMRSA